MHLHNIQQSCLQLNEPLPQFLKVLFVDIDKLLTLHFSNNMGSSTNQNPQNNLRLCLTLMLVSEQSNYELVEDIIMNNK